MSDKEIPLAGGNTSDGVARVGNTVRKKLTQHSATVHKLLKHIEQRGFTGCPEFRGIDNKGREILSFIEGESGISGYIWESDDCLKETANLLRRYHDATLDFPHSSEDSWAYVYPDTQRHEVIGHSDCAPYNQIFRDKLPVAFIDFDLAGPAPRSRDIAYSAFWNIPLSFKDRKMKSFAVADLENNSVRLKMFCNAYGLEATSEIIEMTSEVLAHMGDEDIAKAMVGEVAVTNLKQGGHLQYWLDELSAFEERKAELLKNIQ